VLKEVMAPAKKKKVKKESVDAIEEKTSPDTLKTILDETEMDETLKEIESNRPPSSSLV